MLSVRLVVFLSTAAFVILGTERLQSGQLSHFPPAQETWSSEEYVDFYFAHYNGNRALPHLRSPETAQLFERLVSRDNVQAILESSMPQHRKRGALAVILATMGEIRAAYNYAVFVGEPLAEELTRVQTFMMYLIDIAIGLQSDRERPFAAATSAWKTTFWNAVSALAEQDVYTAGQIASLTNAIDLHYSRISGLLTEADKRRFCERIAELASEQTDEFVREAQQRLLRRANCQ
jgi:hypothetical protein